MVSAFCYTGIACLIFFVVFGKRLKNPAMKYSAGETLIFCVLMRLCPMLMLTERSAGSYIALAVDIAVLTAVFFLSGRLFGREKRWTAAAVYLFDPIAAASIICGKGLYISANIAAAAAVILFLAVTRKILPREASGRFFGGYAFLCAGAFFMIYGAECRGEAFKEISSVSDVPFCLFSGAASAAIAAVLLAKAFFDIKYGKAASEDTTEANIKLQPPQLTVREGFDVGNLLDMTALTVLCGALVFTQLGSTDTPREGMELSGDNKEIMLDFGEYTNISGLKVYLGANDSRKISMFAFNEAEQKWIEMKSEAEISEPFRWNYVEVGWYLRYLDIIFLDDVSYVNEIVALGADGKPIVPINAAEYPALFGEAELYPEYDTYYYRMMFDEVYHGRTAYEFLHGLPIYENTHPPLGKTIISAGISLFGMTPFGWRFMSAVFGTLMVPVMYLFTWKLSHRRAVSILAGALLAAEFMHFTLSRIATVDIIAALFILLMFLFMYCFADALRQGEGVKKQYLLLLLCGVSSALAISVKWTGVYAMAGIAVLFFVSVYEHCIENGGIKGSMPYLTRLCGVCIVCFIIIPLTVYALSYIPFAKAYPDKGIIRHAIENSVYMLSYHSNVTSEHPYESEWYEWLIDKRPLLDALTYIGDTKISSAATFGNPIILWGGLAALLHNFRLWRCGGCKKARFLVIAYFSMLMPWLFIHRTVFIYQYFCCILILIPILCSSVMNLKRGKAVGIILLAGSVLMFVLFFTELSGITADRDYTARFLEWFPTWDFG